MFYIIEHQTRPDGIVNVSEVGRQTFASALSYYHERLSKMAMTELFTTVSIMLVDANLNVKEKKTIPTAYVPPVEESEDVPVEE